MTDDNRERMDDFTEVIADITQQYATEVATHCDMPPEFVTGVMVVFGTMDGNGVHTTNWECSEGLSAATAEGMLRFVLRDIVRGETEFEYTGDEHEQEEQ